MVMLRAGPGPGRGPWPAAAGLRPRDGLGAARDALQSLPAALFANHDIARSCCRRGDTIRSAPFVESMRTAGCRPRPIDAWVEQAGQWRCDDGSASIPSVFVIAGAMMVLANAALLRTYLVRRDPGWLEGGEFEGCAGRSAWRSRSWLAGAAVGVARPASGRLQRAAGAGVLASRCRGWRWSRTTPTGWPRPPFLRLVVLALVLLNPWASQILALLGLFDILVRFPQVGRASGGARAEPATYLRRHSPWK